MIAQRTRATKPPLSKRYTEDEITEVVQKYYGAKSLIAPALDCTPQQLEVWLRDEKHKEVLVQARERILDKAEERMMQILQSSDDRVALESAKFILSRLGRSRGYSGDSPSINIGIQGDDTKVAIQSIFGINE